MNRDVFYFGSKPNKHPKEKFAESLNDARNKSSSEHFWIINEQCDYRNFDWDYDFDLLPDNLLHTKDFINIWPSRVYRDSKTWLCPKQYTDNIIYRTDVEPLNFIIPRYYIKTTLEDLIYEHPSEMFWALNVDFDYRNFDFDWFPEEDRISYVHAFGTKDSIDQLTYLVNAKQYIEGKRDFHYNNFEVDIKKNVDIFFIDMGNIEANDNYEKLSKSHHLKRTRFFNSWIDTISRCVSKSSTNLFYIVNSQFNYDEFDFSFYPSKWQMSLVHVFGTQWNRWGNTFLVNKNTFLEDTKYIKTIEHLPCINFVENSNIKSDRCLYDVILIDFLNENTVKNTIEEKIKKQVTVIPFINNYHETLKQIVDNNNFVYVCSSICDYTTFDFTYHCDIFAKDHLHVFPSNEQKYGDTFLVHTNVLSKNLNKVSSLIDLPLINFNTIQKVKRISPPKITTSDTHTVSVNDFDFPYAILMTNDNNIDYGNLSDIDFWDKQYILSHSTGNSIVTLPKIAKSKIKKELYDYPYIITSENLRKSNPLDIVFLSNNEPNAEENYQHLEMVLHGRKNRLVRVNNVNGRVKAYHAAMEASNTPWAFVVFAKLKINEMFDFDWQPDRLQVPKHYIFHAKNPVNGLEYGHQAMIAYNKKLTLNNNGFGLDFTLDNEHEVIEQLSGTAYFNVNEFITWRTAFREVIKLKNDDTEISKQRLQAWLTIGNGNYYQYSLDGAKHGIEYYENVCGNMEKLKLSYEWEWLKNKFHAVYNI